MKKNYQKWLVGALACALAMPFTGCSGEDDPTPENGNNGTAETFQTQFSIALTKKAKAETRATTAEVGEGDFQGIENINLIAFNTESDNTTYEKVVSDKNVAKTITLQGIAPQEVTGGEKNFVKKYQNVSLPTATVNFMFYGESNYTAAPSGKIKHNLASLTTASTASSIEFSLVDVPTPTNTETSAMTTYLDGVVDKVVAVLNSTTVGSQPTEAQQKQIVGYLNGAVSPSIYQVGYLLGNLYFNTEFANLDGWDALKSAIYTNTVTDNPVFKEANEVPRDIAGLMALIKTENENYLGEDFPKGGQKLTISITKADGSYNKTATKIESNPDNMQNYKYPTSLYYMANTYPVAFTSGNETWTDKVYANSSDFVNLLNTQPAAIALYDQIQYAVGQLAVSVTAENNITGNTSGDGTASSQFNTDNFELLGVLIGSQDKVGFDFQPTSFDGAAYDNKKEAGEDNKMKMNMLALPTAKQEKVKVALELRNNSTNHFYGVSGGIIPAGSVFYLAGELEPTSGTFGGGDQIAEEDRAVFMSDYKTTANFKIKSLKNAYNVVPDLNASNLQFALSVDLSWENGYTFEVDIE